MQSHILLLALPLLISAAQTPPAPCPTPAAALAAWNSPKNVTEFPAGATYAVIEPGTRFDLALTADPIRMWTLPQKLPAPGSHATVVGLKIARAGTYRIAIGTAAWLDVIKDGKFVEAAAHAHGPACSGIRKMVDFTLPAGSYAIQVSGSADTRTGILVTPLP